MPLSVVTVLQGIVIVASLFAEHRKHVAAVLLSRLFPSFFFFKHVVLPLFPYSYSLYCVLQYVYNDLGGSDCSVLCSF